MSKNGKYLLIFILVVIALSPLGLIAEGSAWGEWSNEEIQAMVGFVPSSIENAKPFVEAIIPDYEIGGLNPLVSTWASAVIGAGMVFLLLLGIKKTVKRAS
jgi:hypothetical protein